MKNNVCLIGAGGKMGCRLVDNLKDSRYALRCLETNPQGIERVRQSGLDVSEPSQAISDADFIIFAVPDVAIAKVAAEVVPQMKAGAIGITLDPAAPLAGALPQRSDVGYFAAHPSHPSVFNWEPDQKKHYDYFGGIAAKQTIVCALIQGDDEMYQRCEDLAKTFYAPVSRSHRITLKDMGILEPALSETFAASLVTLMREAVDHVVAKGVPKEAAYDFFLGHINIELALLFDQLPGGRFSDAAIKAIAIGKKAIVKEDWKKIFEDDNVMEQIRAIT